MMVYILRKSPENLSAGTDRSGEFCYNFSISNDLTQMANFPYSDRLVIIAKGFLKLPNLHMLIKQKSPSLPTNLALRTVGELAILFPTKVSQLYLLYSTT